MKDRLIIVLLFPIMLLVHFVWWCMSRETILYMNGYEEGDE